MAAKPPVLRQLPCQTGQASAAGFAVGQMLSLPRNGILSLTPGQPIVN